MKRIANLDNPDAFEDRLTRLTQEYAALLARPNSLESDWGNGVFDRYRHPVLTAAHTPLDWRYDLNPKTNGHLMERLGVNAVFNPGAIRIDGTVYLVCRVEGNDRKSFFAIAESESGVDGFKFWDRPIRMDPARSDETNVYDMRLVRHEDGWIYGLFCAERKDPDAPPGDTSAALAECGIARTKDLRAWERLRNLETPSSQQRNVTLHPEFVDGKYALYTRPQDGFIDAGSGGGIAWGLCDDMRRAQVATETVMEPRRYHTVAETKIGAGPAPIKTAGGWLHIAHGVRGTAAGLRYVLYAFLCDLDNPFSVTHKPGGYFVAPWSNERVGDVSNVVFCNGAVVDDDDRLLIYYASSDTRIHVATTTIDKMLDYVVNTPVDGLSSHLCADQRLSLIGDNEATANDGTLGDSVRALIRDAIDVGRAGGRATKR